MCLMTVIIRKSSAWMKSGSQEDRGENKAWIRYWKEWLSVCERVCLSIFLTTGHPIDFTLGRFIATDLRHCRVRAFEIWQTYLLVVCYHQEEHTHRVPYWEGTPISRSTTRWAELTLRVSLWCILEHMRTETRHRLVNLLCCWAKDKQWGTECAVSTAGSTTQHGLICLSISLSTGIRVGIESPAKRQREGQNEGGAGVAALKGSENGKTTLVLLDNDGFLSANRFKNIVSLFRYKVINFEIKLANLNRDQMWYNPYCNGISKNQCSWKKVTVNIQYIGCTYKAGCLDAGWRLEDASLGTSKSNNHD